TRPAAEARSEARQLGRLWYREERDLAAPRTPAGTRGAAIDPRRVHRIDECAVVPAITRQHDAPATLGRQVGNDSGTAHARKLARGPATIYPVLTVKPHAQTKGQSYRSPSPGGRGGQGVWTERGSGGLQATGYAQGSSADGP